MTDRDPSEDRTITRGGASEPQGPRTPRPEDARLGTLASFRDLGPDLLRGLEASMFERRFEAGEPLMRQGDAGDSLMVVQEGEVEVFVTIDGARHVLKRAGAREVFGEMALLTREPRTASVVARTPVRALVLPAEDFHRLARSQPSLAEVLSRLTAQRLGEETRDALSGKMFHGYTIRRRIGRGGKYRFYIEQAGGRMVLVQTDAAFQPDLDPIAAAITPRTRAIVVVHFAGRACEMDRIVPIARRHGIALVEDCAHAIETTMHGRHAGTFGDVGCLSFYVTKNVVTGEGGMAITPRKEIADRRRTLALHGMTKDAWRRFSDKGYIHYDVVEPGFKYNMMDIQAAIVLHQLARVGRTWKRREEIWRTYCEAFRNLPVFLPAPSEPDTRHAYHLFTLLLDTDRLAVSRDGFLERMTARGIGTGVHYRAVHLHPLYRDRFGYRVGQLPNAEWISDRTVSLPLSPKLTRSQRL